MTDLEQAQKALNKAKVNLMARPDSTFFSSVALSMQHKWDEKIPTACTNGKEIRYNPSFWLSLSQEEQVFLLLHETLHVALMHVIRLSMRNPRKWNYAGDYVINLMLVKRGYKMPTGGLLDHQYDGMSTEQVYDLLDDKDIPENFQMDMEENQGDPKELQQDLDDILVRATLQSQLAGDDPGSIPGDVQVYINGLLNPVMPWHQILRRYMYAMNKNDYSFRKPNRRFFPDHILPTRYSENLDHIAVVVDTSGSVTDNQFKQFVSETHAILKGMNPKKITFIQFDWKIQAIDEVYRPEDLMKLSFTGRGGTRIEPVIEWVAEHKPKITLVFTDGEFHIKADDPKTPIVWLIHGGYNFQPPYGRVIPFNK